MTPELKTRCLKAIEKADQDNSKTLHILYCADLIKDFVLRGTMPETSIDKLLLYSALQEIESKYKEV